MRALKIICLCFLPFLVLSAGCQNAADKGVASGSSVTIMYSPKASVQERLAVKEIRRYVYLRSGELLKMASAVTLPKEGDVIVIANNERELIDSLRGTLTESIGPSEYIIRTVTRDGRKVLVIAGGDSIGTLYGAYEFIEHLGIRFYLHGDTIPDKKIAFNIPDLEEVGKPLFKLRGIQPFHDFPEGPDWWNVDDYKAVISQLPKLRMNFIGLHCYPEGGAGPEPTVWIGLAKDIADDGKVKS
ncbi:MAG: alpha-glucuronidase family glycosyl hydrolase, partial [Planctomycetota bacterium]